jgi:uroporphyrinogen decarboxylase
LDPQLLKTGGKPLEEAVQFILSTLKGHPYIFNLGHGILPATPPDHVAQVLNWVRSQAA